MVVCTFRARGSGLFSRMTTSILTRSGNAVVTGRVYRWSWYWYVFPCKKEASCFSGWHVLHQSGRKDTHERGPYLCDWSKFETSYFQSRGLSEETTLLGGTFLFSDFAGTRRRPERNPTSRKWQLATWHTCKDAGSSSGPSCCVIAIARRTNMNVRDFELWARSNGFNALRVSRSTDRDETPANIGPKHRHARNLTLLERDVRAQIKDER